MKYDLVKDVCDCSNPKCITKTEQELKTIGKKVGDAIRCIYCDNNLK